MPYLSVSPRVLGPLAAGASEAVTRSGPRGHPSLLIPPISPPTAAGSGPPLGHGLRPCPNGPAVARPDGAGGWVPPAESCAGDQPDAWHPLDALFAPLVCPAGTLVGMLSVDLPHDGRRPGPLQQELLSMFATQAGIAIDNARLTEQLNSATAATRHAFSRTAVPAPAVETKTASGGGTRLPPNPELSQKTQSLVSS